jgi:BirA family transcriptional regulator, biotin operon repressor / biotin---[acetyl-CoA-carboxylase] ligase
MGTREKVLGLLEEHRGEYLSGEGIAKRLGISRNAVWKGVSALKAEGYQIASVTKKGYCLLESNDILSAAGIMKALGNETRLEKENIHIYDSLPSTNREATRLAAEEKEGMQLVIAETQSQGRGHREHSFLSPKGGIYMSLLLHPEDLPFETESAAILTAYGAVSVAKAIERQTGVSLQIKWVNDLFLNRRKVCGILTEAGSDFESGHLKWIVMGIGINFSTSIEEFPKELWERVTSLCPSADGEQEIKLTRNELIAEIIKELLQGGGLPDQREKKLQELLQEYQGRLLYRGERRRILSVAEKEEAFIARIEGVDQDGRLLVRDEEGREKKLSFRKWTIE